MVFAYSTGLTVVRDTVLHRFSKAPEGIATNILSARLKKLKELGLIDQVKNERMNKMMYVLTESGRDFEGVPRMADAWSSKHLADYQPRLMSLSDMGYPGRPPSNASQGTRHAVHMDVPVPGCCVRHRAPTLNTPRGLDTTRQMVIEEPHRHPEQGLVPLPLHTDHGPLPALG